MSIQMAISLRLGWCGKTGCVRDGYDAEIDFRFYRVLPLRLQLDFVAEELVGLRVQHHDRDIEDRRELPALLHRLLDLLDFRLDRIFIIFGDHEEVGLLHGELGLDELRGWLVAVPLWLEALDQLVDENKRLVGQPCGASAI